MVNIHGKNGKNGTGSKKEGDAKSAGNKPVKKYQDIVRTADKNAKTIVKISQLQVW